MDQVIGGAGSLPFGGLPVFAGWADLNRLAWTYANLDLVRRAQGDALDAFGLAPEECPYGILASDRLWRLRAYTERPGPPLLIVAAPIKRPYIWDLEPSRSVVRRCLDQGLQVFLLEWLPASEKTAKAGIGDYAGRALEQAIAAVSRHTGLRPVVMGHSLGGAFAAIHAALAEQTLRGLVLLSAPVCFAPGSSRFRDALVALLPAALAEIKLVPGSLLTQLCVWAAPDIFVWARAMDAGLSCGDPEALRLLGRVERWALDELPLPGTLVRDIFTHLYREDRFCGGRLEVQGEWVGPDQLQLPTLVVVNRDDEIAPPGSVAPFLAALPEQRCRMIAHGGEPGVGLQHLAVLMGRQARDRVWPQILSWLRDAA